MKHENDAKEYHSVERPKHYNLASMETIDIIDRIIENEPNPSVSHAIGTAVKYLHRFRHKGAPEQDLGKAIWYIRRAIRHIKKEGEDE